MSKKKIKFLKQLKDMIHKGINFCDSYIEKKNIYEFIKPKNNNIELCKKFSKETIESLTILATTSILEHSNTPEEGETLIMDAFNKQPYLAYVIVNHIAHLNNYHTYKRINIELDYLNKLEKERKLTRIEKEEKTKLIKMYRGLCKYKDVYETINYERRKGITLNKAIIIAIEKQKDNIFVKKLLEKYNNDTIEIVEYLHNAYYKTRYKDYYKYP
jgi:hypothetical protein